MSFDVIIVDYGAGNLRSVERAVARAGFEPQVSSRFSLARPALPRAAAASP